MSCLFVNACWREGSRTLRLARRVLATVDEPVVELDLARADVRPLDRERLAEYDAAVATGDYASDLFDHARQFAAADEVIIAAPCWNCGVPALLHCYLELVCSQGVTFDIAPDGGYMSLCHARRLTYVTTAGGPIVEADDHAFGYLKTLCRTFWDIGDVRQIKADGLDIVGADVEALLDAALP